MDLDQYPHTMNPFQHQLDYLKDHVHNPAWGLLWEQGTAKTKPIVDTACVLYSEGKIDALMVVAPPGVDRNWNTDEIPKHMPPEFALDTMVAVWDGARKHTKAHIRKMDALLEYDGLAVFLISYDAFMTKDAKKFIWDFLKTRKVLYVLDEAHNIKAPNSKRTKSILASSKYAPFRRVLTGTPMSVGPFDLYTQIRFLDEYFWKNKGISGAVEFRNFFGVYFTRDMCKELNGYDPGFDKLIEYQNLDLLKQWLTEISDRKEKDDVLDLPPKLYSKRYFDLSREQQAAYDELRSEKFLEIGETIIDGSLPIVMMLRAQQITCNYVPTENEEPVHMFSEKNPRIGVMEDIRDGTYKPAIVWARFRHDIDQLMDLLGKDAVRYDGTMSQDEAELSKLKFQRGDAKWFVGTAQKGGPGLTLHQAKTVVYYSNSFRLIDRLQSEDRAHRAGMDDQHVDYIDICSNTPTDNHIIDNLRGKRDLISDIQGDKWKDWI